LKVNFKVKVKVHFHFKINFTFNTLPKAEGWNSPAG
jgi:hypothetical protein